MHDNDFNWICNSHRTETHTHMHAHTVCWIHRHRHTEMPLTIYVTDVNNTSIKNTHSEHNFQLEIALERYTYYKYSIQNHIRNKL